MTDRLVDTRQVYDLKQEVARMVRGIKDAVNGCSGFQERGRHCGDSGPAYGKDPRF